MVPMTSSALSPNELERVGSPIAPGYEVDLEPLHAGVPAGPEYAVISEHIRRTHHEANLIKPVGGLGQRWALTPLGIARAGRIRLDRVTVEKARSVAGARIAERQDAFRRTARELTAGYHFRNLYDSSMERADLGAAVAKESTERARSAWSLYRRLLEHRGVDLTDSICDLVKSEIRDLVRDTSDDMREVLAGSPSIPSDRGSLAVQVERGLTSVSRYRHGCASARTATHGA
jgi:hypothetical protein